MNRAASPVSAPIRRGGFELVGYHEAQNDVTELEVRGLNGWRDRMYIIYWYFRTATASSAYWKLWLNGRTGDTAASEYKYHDTGGNNLRGSDAFPELSGNAGLGDFNSVGKSAMFCSPRVNTCMLTQIGAHAPGTAFRAGQRTMTYWANTDNVTWLLAQMSVDKALGKGSWIAVYRDPIFGGRRDRD